MKIKIAHVAGGLTTGGVEAVLYNYFSHMPREDYELHYISYNPPNEEVQKKFEAIGFQVHEVCKKKEHFFKSCRQVVEVFKENEITIVHSHMTLISFITSFLGRMCGVKYCIAHSHLAQHITGLKKYVYGAFKWLTKHTSTHFFACGREAAEYVYGKKALENGRVTLMHNAIDTKSYAFDPVVRERVRGELGIKNAFCIGHVGRFTEQKNHTFLIDIMKEIVVQRKDAVLLLFGEGELQEDIREKVKLLSLEEHVRFMGPVADMHEYYDAMDVFLLPSLYEGLAVSLVEAQCNGVMVVTSDTVTDEIKLSDRYEILSLSQSAKEWADMVCADFDVGEERKNAYKMIEDAGYSIEKEAEKLDAFYKKLLLEENR